MWGQPLTGEMRRRKVQERNPGGEEGDGEVTGQQQGPPRIEVRTEAEGPELEDEQGEQVRLQEEALEPHRRRGRDSAKGPRLPGSLAAAVKASQYESRETWPPGGHPAGEGVKRMRADAAAKYKLQVARESGVRRGWLKRKHRHMVKLESRTDRHCKRLQRLVGAFLVWSVEQERFCCDQCKRIRQGGHRGAVGRVRSGEG